MAKNYSEELNYTPAPINSGGLPTSGLRQQNSVPTATAPAPAQEIITVYTPTGQSMKIPANLAQTYAGQGYTMVPPKTEVGMIGSDAGAKTVNEGKGYMDQNYPVVPPATPVEKPKTPESPKEPAVTGKAYFTNQSGQEAEYTQEQLNDPAIQNFLKTGGYILAKSDGVNVNADFTTQPLQNSYDDSAKRVENLTNDFLSYNVDQDPDFQNQAQVIKGQFDKLRREMEQVNYQRQRAYETLGMRSGTTQYAGGIQMGIEGEELSQANSRLADITQQEAEAVSAARTAFKNNEFTEFSQKVNALKDLRDEKSKQLGEYNKVIAAYTKKLSEESSKELDDLYKKTQIQKIRQEMLQTDIDSFASGLVDYDEEGNIDMASQEDVQKFADEAGVPYEQVVGAVRKKAYELSKLSAEDRKREIDIANAMKEGKLKDLEISEKNGVVDPNMGTYERNILVSRIGKQIYGTKISDAESKRVESFIDAGGKMGKTEQQIMDDVIGYKITKPELQPVADAIRTTLLQGAGEDGLAGFDMYGVARLLNEGKTAEAVNKAEKMILDKQDDVDTKNRESATNYISNKGDAIIKQINSLSTKFGLAAGNWEKLKKKVSGTTEFQKISSDLKALVSDWRHEMLGVAVTPNEANWLDDLEAKTTDNPLNAIEKIKSFQNMNMEQLNSRRSLYGLPSLDKTSLSDMKERAKLYNEELQTLEDNFANFYSNAQDKGAIDSLMSNPEMGKTEEDRMRAIMEYQISPGKTEPLSMGQKGSETIKKVVSVPDKSTGGECGSFVYHTTGVRFGDTYKEKLAKMDPSIKQPEPGMIFTMPYSWTGHTGVILDVQDGIATVKDSNWNKDKKVLTHQIPVSKMTGFRKV